MGIPSYFRRIIQKFPGIVSNKLSADAAEAEAQVLCFDFNCLIYRCIRSPGMPSAPGLGADPYDIDIWEAVLLKEVLKTVKEVWTVAGRPKKVYLAVDGVVPMAKIRQQRVRRFKSAWLRRQSGSDSGWDSNSITPGTAFMDKLTRELEGLVKEHGKGWELSSVHEQGEGEHKLMRWLCSGGEYSKIIIYGLDADLILLSMICSETLKKPVWLLREKQEFGSPGAETVQTEQEYSFMNIEELKIRVGVKGLDETINYVTLMSLMGNDFLPHSLTHKLNENGHECVMQEFRTMKKTGRFMVVDQRIQYEIVAEVCKRWSADEAELFLRMIEKKRDQARRGVLKGMDASEGLPLTWDAESVFFKGGSLVEGWRDEYWKFIHPCADREKVCSEYLYGLQWILDYYLGRPVNMRWMFSAWIPPLWSDLGKFGQFGAGGGGSSSTEPIKPAEQLAMVLPLDSWGLIRDPQLRKLPLLAPQMWPRDFEFLSIGRKWLWECEARIPVLTAERLREILKEAS